MPKLRFANPFFRLKKVVSKLQSIKQCFHRYKNHGSQIQRKCHNSDSNWNASMKDCTVNSHSSLKDPDPIKKIQIQPDLDQEP
jgi:hypothetical protein